MNGKGQNALTHVEQVMRILVEIRNEGKILIRDLYQSQLPREISRHSMTCKKSWKFRNIKKNFKSAGFIDLYECSYFLNSAFLAPMRAEDNDLDKNLKKTKMQMRCER